MVERPVACSGKGRYVAIVHHGSQGGRLYRRTFIYSHKDPRYKGEAEVLWDISHMVATRYRQFIVAISVVKKCLHPKSPAVPKAERSAHIERVFSWVVEHDNSINQISPRAVRQYEEGNLVQSVVLPYTPYELQQLPVQCVVVTRYWDNAYASVGVRGVERSVALTYLLARKVQRAFNSG